MPVNSTAVKLSWKPPGDEFVKDYFLVQESNGTSVFVANLSFGTDTYIMKVMPESAYNFSIYARINISGAPFISLLETASTLHCTVIPFLGIKSAVLLYVVLCLTHLVVCMFTVNTFVCLVVHS